MKVTLLSRVIDALNSGYERCFRTLDGVELRCGDDGFVECYIGSNVIVVPLVGDESLALRFYIVSMPYLREIYGSGYHPAEFSVGDETIDVVVIHWVEGVTLAECVEEALQQQNGVERLITLSHAFDMFASRIVESEWAHGDICCENIIVTDSGELGFVDNDSNYIPELEGCCSGELGHAAYQSPKRDIDHFHSRIDDFSIALISVSLAALSIQPSLYSVRQSLDSLLLDGANLSGGSLYDDVADVLKRGCKVAHLAMLRELRCSPIVIDRLPELLLFTSRGVVASSRVEMFERGGLWGYCDGDTVVTVIPPMFDMVCDYDGDEAIVSVERMWYMIDRKGSIRRYEL